MELGNHIEDEKDVELALTNGGTSQNGPNRLGEHRDAKEKRACQWFTKKNIAIVFAVVFILFLVSIISNFIQAEIIKKLQATPCPSGGSFHNWSQHGDWCYFFSDEQRNLSSSRHNCSSYGASLITLDPEEEWDKVQDIIKIKGNEFWINLQRKKADQPWRWPDGSNVTQFTVKGSDLCGYMDVDGVSSTSCNSDRHWVCRKPAA